MHRIPYFLIAVALVAACTLPACTTLTPRPEVREVASTTRIAIVVEQNTLLARGLHNDVAGKLRQKILETRSGVPVQDVEAADLVLRVQILDVNFTHALKWEWQLIEPNGAVLISKIDDSIWGASAEKIAADITLGIASIDLMAYSSGGAAPVRAQRTVTTPSGGPESSGDFPKSSTNGANAWAVVIGIEEYRENLPDATGAEADARAFAAFARQTLNVPEFNIKTLLGPRASKADITATLMEWLPRNAVEPGGRVYIFFSGHGAPDVEAGTSYLVPYDGNPTFVRSTGIAVTDIQAQFEALKDQEVYVFLDSCFSGQGDRSVLPAGTRPLVPVKRLEASPTVITFTASGSQETTGAHMSSGHGLFTHFLLDGLTGGADANGDGHVTVDELNAHIVDHVRREARRQNRDQTPRLIAPASTSARSVIVHGLPTEHQN